MLRSKITFRARTIINSCSTTLTRKAVFLVSSLFKYTINGIGEKEVYNIKYGLRRNTIKSILFFKRLRNNLQKDLLL